jgi:hypothetical protein
MTVVRRGRCAVVRKLETLLATTKRTRVADACPKIYASQRTLFYTSISRNAPRPLSVAPLRQDSLNRVLPSIKEREHRLSLEQRTPPILKSPLQMVESAGREQ